MASDGNTTSMDDVARESKTGLELKAAPSVDLLRKMIASGKSVPSKASLK